MTLRTVQNWERGLSRPRAEQVKALAVLFRYDTDVLLFEAGYAPQEQAAHTKAQPFPLDALNWDDFERFCAYLLERLYPQAKVHPLGGQGHTQSGLDLQVIFPNGDVYSFQCKRVKQFGPEKVEDVISAHLSTAKRKFLLLSRIASPDARNALIGHFDWDIWDVEDLSRRVRDLSPEEQIRIVDIFFKGQQEALIGVTKLGPWRTVEEFFSVLQESRSPYHHNWQLIGRDELVEQVCSSLIKAEPPLKIICGPGGAGKSRILKKVLEQVNEQVPIPFLIRIAAPDEEISVHSVNDLGTRWKILAIDDAHECNELAPIIRHVANPQNNTSLLLVSRLYGLAPLRALASQCGITAKVVVVDNFSEETSAALARQVLTKYGGSLSHANTIAKLTLDCPLATVFASYIVATEQIPAAQSLNNKQFRQTLLSRFQTVITGEINSRIDSKSLQSVMRIIAMVQPFHVDDDNVHTLIERVELVSRDEARRAIRDLCDAGLIFRPGGASRLSPDMLADFILEDRCVDTDGKSTGYAERVFDSCASQQLKNLFVNIGKLDWRLSASDQNAKLFSDEVWKKLAPSSNWSDSHIAAVNAIAHYQPVRALDFVDKTIRSRKFLEQLPDIVYNAVTEHPEYIKRACESLWELAKNDSRELNRYPDHPMRVLRKLAEFTPYLSPEISKSVVHFAINLSYDRGTFDFVHNPFEILDAALETQLHRGVQSNGSMYIERINAVPSLVEKNREAIVDCLLKQILNADLKVAIYACRSIHDALRHPVNRANEAEWVRHFQQVLEKILTAVSNQSLSPFVMFELAKAVTWHANRGSKQTARLAKKILQKVPTNLEYRTIANLIDGTDNYGKSYKTNELITRNLAEELHREYSTSLELFNYLDQHLQQLKTLPVSRHNSGALMFRVIEKSVKHAEKFIDYCLSKPDSSLCELVDMALAKILRDAPSAGTKMAKLLFDSKLPFRKHSVGLAYWRSKRSADQLSEEDREIIKELLRSPEDNEVSSVFNLISGLTLHSQMKESVNLAIDFIKCIEFEQHPRLVDRIISFIASESIAEQISLQDIRFFLNALLVIPDIDEYNVQKFLASVSAHNPNEILKFLMDRVDLVCRLSNLDYCLFSGDSSDQVQLKFHRSPDFATHIEKLFEWLKSNDSTQFKRTGAELFRQVTRQYGPDVLAYFSNVAKFGTDEEVSLVIPLLKEADRDFVFREKAFICDFLKRTHEVGVESHESAITALFSATMSGLKHAEFGKPYEEDVSTNENATTVLLELNRFDPAFKLYDSLKTTTSQFIEAEQRYQNDELGL